MKTIIILSMLGISSFAHAEDNGKYFFDCRARISEHSTLDFLVDNYNNSTDNPYGTLRVQSYGVNKLLVTVPIHMSVGGFPGIASQISEVDLKKFGVTAENTYGVFTFVNSRKDLLEGYTWFRVDAGVSGYIKRVHIAKTPNGPVLCEEVPEASE